MRYLMFVLIYLLSGCTPFIGYEHLSQPNVKGDGYDLICVGGEFERGRFRGDLAMCENIASNRGTYGKIEGRILLGKNND